MNVRIVLIVLVTRNAELQLVLPNSGCELPSIDLDQADADVQAAMLAESVCGTADRIQRHGFLSASEADSSALTLLYRQLLSEDQLQGELSNDVVMVPLDRMGEILDEPGRMLVNRVVADLKSDLDQVMHSRLNKQGLVNLLNVLPDIFDHKELAAAYRAFTGEKPPSSLMLARMMLDHYTIGSGDKMREVQGRDLIREYDAEKPELLGQKRDKNKELYRSGGPKAKRLYRKNLPV